MHIFRKKLLKSPVPVNLLSVIKKLIPPKGIRRVFEGSELLDYIEDDLYLFEDERTKLMKPLTKVEVKVMMMSKQSVKPATKQPWRRQDLRKFHH